MRAAIIKMKKGPGNGKLFTGEDWNDEATLTEGSYPYSKVCASFDTARASSFALFCFPAILPGRPQPGNRGLSVHPHRRAERFQQASGVIFAHALMLIVAFNTAGRPRRRRRAGSWRTRRAWTS